MATKHEPAEGDLRIWWIPQVPMEGFEVPVSSIRDARLLLSVLGDYDLFQLQHNIKPDYCNAGRIQIFHDNEWLDMEDDEIEEMENTGTTPDWTKPIY
ncbi:MAG: hypothetical protein WC444_05240 [Candidatus Paceibacterota bacterium]